LLNWLVAQVFTAQPATFFVASGFFLTPPWQCISSLFSRGGRRDISLKKVYENTHELRVLMPGFCTARLSPIFSSIRSRRFTLVDAVVEGTRFGVTVTIFARCP
jgi:hypothetical protein